MDAKKRTKKQKQFAHNMRVAASILLVVLLVAALWFFSDTDAAKRQVSAAMARVSELFSRGNVQARLLPAPETLPAEPYLDVYVFDVGQGDSIFIISPDGKTMLVDTGEEEYIYRLNTYLKALGITRIDALVASHPHSDHIGGMRQLIQTFDIGAFYMPDAESTSATYEGMIAALYDEGIDSHIVYAGGSTALPDLGEDVEITVLSPYKDVEFADLNDMSLLLRIEYGESSILLTGDMEEKSEELAYNMFGADELDSDVLKVGHHGSPYSSTDVFLDAVSPEYALISCGKGNDYGHPDPAVLARLMARGAKIYRTDTGGSIRVIMTEDGIEVYQ